MANLVLSDITNDTISAASTTVNANNDLIEAAVDGKIDSDGSVAMSANLDLGTYKVINGPAGALATLSDTDLVTKAHLTSVATGVAGADGDDGDPGSVWYVGSGVPSSGTGVDGDMYLDSVTCDVYGPKASSLWGGAATNIKGASGAGTGDLVAANNLSDVSNASTALSNLGGQPLDTGLTSIAALTTAADKLPYTTASDVYAVTDLTSFARTLLDDATAGAMRTTLGLGDAVTYNIGQASSTIAEGDDSRFSTLPITTKGTANFLAAEAGGMVRNATGVSPTWTLGTGVFSAGDVISLRNPHDGGTVSITCSAPDLYISGETSTSGSLSFAPGGLATLICEATDTYVISGTGIT